jgi:hypothetical protein
MRMSKPGTGLEEESGLTGISPMPAGLASMGHPLSVCHQ